VVLHLLSILVGEARLLVLRCAGDRCIMAGSNEYRGMGRRPGADDWGWSSTGRIIGGQMIERSGDIVCGLHHVQRDEERGFLGLASK
jgi:hypothetical protein